MQFLEVNYFWKAVYDIPKLQTCTRFTAIKIRPGSKTLLRLERHSAERALQIEKGSTGNLVSKWNNPKIKLSIEPLKPGESLTRKNQKLICFKNETHYFYRFFIKRPWKNRDAKNTGTVWFRMTTLVRGSRAACWIGNKKFRFQNHAARSITKEPVILNDALAFEGTVKDL